MSWIITLCLAALSFTASGLQVTGATGGVDPTTKARPFRYEINQFAQNGGPAWDLYILSMKNFQAYQQSNATSFFQIAGIHGWPITDWDGVHGTNGKNYPGYCMHAAVTFPTWHRPYLALFEQLIVQNAMAIAQTYPSAQVSTYVNAATTLRIPYWDWAVNPALPNAVTTTTVTVNTPQGQQTISNPLYQYNFQSTGTGNGFPRSSNPVANLPMTVRHYNSRTGQSNQTDATVSMQKNAANVLSLVYQLFTQITDYTTFSCTYPGGRSNRANNVENIHNGIHNSIGGSPGHMSYPEIAAFDPIFWLHHANVDRVFAMWQALNPNSYIASTTNAYGSYYEVSGTVDSGTTSLAPFHSGSSGTGMYTNNGVKSMATFGYSYPEVVDWNVSQSDLAANVRTKVNQLYNPTPPSQRRARRGLDLSSLKIPDLKLNNFNLTNVLGNIVPDIEKLLGLNITWPFENVGLDLAKQLGVNNLNMQWSVQLQMDRFASNSTFEILFFIGNPPNDVSSWESAANLIGVHAQFIPADVDAAHPDGRPDGGLQGEVSLTHVLAAAQSRGYLSSLSPDVVVPLLQQGLQWRAKSGGNQIDISTISNLSLMVTSQTVQPRKSISQFPTYGPVVQHPECTAGRNGQAPSS